MSTAEQNASESKGENELKTKPLLGGEKEKVNEVVRKGVYSTVF